MPDQKILLFGKNGQLGSVLNKKLSAYNLVALDYPEIDFNQPNSLQEIISSIKPSLIVNAAAYTAVDLAEQEKQKAFNINAVSVQVIARAAKNIQAGLIHYSTDYIFDGEKNQLYQEDDQPNPINVYGASKLLGEQSIIQAQINYLIFRLSWVYSTTHPSFLGSILDWASKYETLRIVDDQTSNPTWANMVADKTAEIIALAAGEWPGFFHQYSGTYHLVGKGAVTRFEWAKAILELAPDKSGHKTKEILSAKSTDFNTAAIRPAFSGLDCSKFEKTFNLSLPHWKQSLAEAMSSIGTS